MEKFTTVCNNDKTANDNPIPNILYINNKCIDEEREILNVLNHHFINVANRIIKGKFVKENVNKLEQFLREKLRHHVFNIEFITPLGVKCIIHRQTQC